MALLYRWAGKTFFVLCFAAFAAVTLGSSHAPLLRDYPDWVYQGALLAKALTGHPVVGYALKHYPVPNSITTVSLAGLTVAFGWMPAAKLWLVLYLTIAAATSFFAASTFRSREELWWALPAVLFFGQGFWFGTISFNIGVCLLLALACLLYRREERAWVIGGVLLLCFFMHLIVYAAAGVLVLLYCIQQQRWRLTWAGLATLPLPLWYFAGRSLSQSSETQFGYSPPSHLAVPALVAAVCLSMAFLRPGRALSRSVVPPLLLVGALVLTAAVASTAVQESHLKPSLQSALLLLRLKAVVPFQLFGFVNIIYYPESRPLLSATLHVLRRPLFLALMALTVGVGLVVIAAIGNRMYRNRSAGHQEPARFLWDFSMLFALLYFCCPPNALGVISIDMRLAQMALFPALFLFARNNSRVLRVVSAPLALVALVSLYQFSLSQREVYMPSDEVRLHPQLAGFAAVDPTSIADEYDRLREGKMEGFIWTTGLFNQTIPWKHYQPVGR